MLLAVKIVVALEEEAGINWKGAWAMFLQLVTSGVLNWVLTAQVCLISENSSKYTAVCSFSVMYLLQ